MKAPLLYPSFIGNRLFSKICGQVIAHLLDITFRLYLVLLVAKGLLPPLHRAGFVGHLLAYGYMPRVGVF